MLGRPESLRRRPPGLAGGISGSISAHCASLKSVAYAVRLIPPTIAHQGRFSHRLLGPRTRPVSRLELREAALRLSNGQGCLLAREPVPPCHPPRHHADVDQAAAEPLQRRGLVV